ncbi:lactoylglutathione lyase-like lyase [Frankia sp. EI5c]|uniref:VOC family protein n=1 Tax=Frankia sp. EI5c TaxID=683316 RepID=UPI0007C33412|nr:VOC family protein [Frankia sp. EI5c]OAA18982.1 lactoylglutathione lyase-like lyase [Frankia sp. EI5c]
MTARGAGVDHVGITVPDLDAASSLFVRLLGARSLYRRAFPADPARPESAEPADPARPTDPARAGGLSRQLAVHPDATFRVERLRLAGTDLELWEWHAPDQATAVPRVCDLGGAHLAFEVADVAATAEAFRAEPGVRVLGEPQTLGADHPLAGRVWIYVLLPWGTAVELVSPSPREAIEAQAESEAVSRPRRS